MGFMSGFLAMLGAMAAIALVIGVIILLRAPHCIWTAAGCG